MKGERKMNKKGGYQIIDLKDFNFTEDNDEYELTLDEYSAGLKFFNNIFGKNKKPLLITNIVINGVEKNDVIITDYDINLCNDTEMLFTMYEHNCKIYNDTAICYFVISF